MNKLPERIHYICDSNWFPETLLIFTEVSSETTQKLKIHHNNIEIKNQNAENQSFSFANIPDNTNTSVEESSADNIDNIVQSQPMDKNFNETTENGLIFYTIR